MKFLVFGTGEYYERFKKWIANEEVVALLDNAPAKQHTVIDGVEVVSPREGVARDYDAVIIMSFYIKAMKKQLMELGVAAEKIFHFYDLRKLINLGENRQKIQCYGITEQELRVKAKMSIGLLSTDLVFGGTAIALFHMAKVLRKLEYPVIFASMMDGPLRERLEEQEIPVIIDPNLQLATMRETEWLANFRLIICNAVNYYIFLSERDLHIPMVWWLHDSAFFYDGVDREVLKRIQKQNLIVCSVGPVPERALHSVRPDMSAGELLYGVEDTVKVNGTCKKRTGAADDVFTYPGEKVCFVTIGHIEERKGQDILLEAIGRLPGEIREKALFCFVGKDSSLLAEKIREAVQNLREVILTGVLDREGIEELLGRTDVLICPSREDPMPTVAAEAMMHGVPCLISDAAGTSAYIKDEKDGLVFGCGDIRELAEKIVWCVKNREKLSRMGENARKVYEEKFSMYVFERNLKALMRHSGIAEESRRRESDAGDHFSGWYGETAKGADKG